ncbi:hypothetical protein MauCBS54593_003942 [Microsporum audouinii]
MQQSWRQDADKLTFITCQPVSSLATCSDDQGASGPVQDNNSYQVKPKGDDALEKMIGDVNMFLKLEENDTVDGESSDVPKEVVVGEVELMIAEKHLQRKGFGRASLVCFLKYVIDHMEQILAEFQGHAASTQVAELATIAASGKKQLEYLVVRIAAKNERSIALFKSLGFDTVSDGPNVFGELELRKYGLESSGELRMWMQHYGIEEYMELPYH